MCGAHAQVLSAAELWVGLRTGATRADGVVAGVWHQRRSGRRLDVTVEMFGPLPAFRRRELETQVERVGRVLEGTPTLTLGPVTVGPHA